MGNKMGIRTSRKSIESRLAETVKQLQAQQNQFLDTDDRLSVDELYRRELMQTPISTRQMLAGAGMSSGLLSTPFPVPSSVVKAKQTAGNIKLSFKLIRYSTTDLLQLLGKNIKISEEEVKAEYNRKEKLKEGKDLASYESQKELIENELKTAKKQKELGSIKKELSEMKTPDLEKISSMTHAPIIQLKSISLENMKSVAAGSTPVNLARAEILSNPVQGNYGPFQDGEYTLYVQLTDVSVQKVAPIQKDFELIQKNISSGIGTKVYYFLMDNEARTGKFSLNPALDGSKPLQ
jgi:hypothetical protein